MPELHNIISLIDHNSHPTLKNILKFQSHPSVSAIRKTVSGKTRSFSQVSVGEIIKEIKTLITREAILSTDSPIKIGYEHTWILYSSTFQQMYRLRYFSRYFKTC